MTVGLLWIDPASHRNVYAAFNADPHAVDPLPAARAVAARINATGGIGGRPVELRHQEVPLSNDFDAEFEAACQHFLDGPRPLAVINGPLRVVQVGGCLGRAGIPLIADPAVAPGREWLAGPGALTALPAPPAIDRIQADFVVALVDADFFAGNAKLGLIWQAREEHRPGVAAFKAALRARGLKLTDEHELPPTRGLPDVPRLAGEVASVMVRFRSRGVDRVVVIDHSGELTGVVMLAAEAQKYRPRWGITSASGPHQLAGHLPREQLAGAVGIGWHPTIDVLAVHEGSRTDTYHTCSEIFRSAGAPTGGRAIHGQGLTYAMCDGLLLLQTALAGRKVSAESLQSALDGLGTRFSSALGFATRLGPGRRDGMDGYRRLRYDASGCGCFRYD